MVEYSDGSFPGNMTRGQMNDKLVNLGERRVAQEAYHPLKMAIEIIGLLNTAIPRGLPDMAQRRLPNARAKITDLSLYFMDQTKNFMKRKYPW
jgi:hypothetical protein